MAAEGDQLDLFRDSRAVMLANETIEALLAADLDGAANALERLRAEEPAHGALDAFRCLLRELLESPPPAQDAAEVAVALHRLESEIEPAARVALGDRAAEFMRPRWRELAEAARSLPYDATAPQAHCAGLFLRCGQAQAAAEAAQSIPDWRRNADALYWHALACDRAGRPAECIQSAMRLALVAPARLPIALAQLRDAALDRDWAAFRMQCDWLEPDDDTAPAWFPAWYLVEHSGAELRLDEGRDLPDTHPAQVASLLTHLLALEKRGYSPDLVSARGRLRDLDRHLFEHYMTRRQVGHS
jgi:hypothetical protein